MQPLLDDRWRWRSSVCVALLFALGATSAQPDEMSAHPPVANETLSRLRSQCADAGGAALITRSLAPLVGASTAPLYAACLCSDTFIPAAFAESGPRDVAALRSICARECTAYLASPAAPGQLAALCDGQRGGASSATSYDDWRSIEVDCDEHGCDGFGRNMRAAGISVAALGGLAALLIAAHTIYAEARARRARTKRLEAEQFERQLRSWERVQQSAAQEANDEALRETRREAELDVETREARRQSAREAAAARRQLLREVPQPGWAELERRYRATHGEKPGWRPPQTPQPIKSAAALALEEARAELMRAERVRARKLRLRQALGEDARKFP